MRFSYQVVKYYSSKKKEKEKKAVKYWLNFLLVTGYNNLAI
jgi:hypothetical protein